MPADYNGEKVLTERRYEKIFSDGRTLYQVICSEGPLDDYLTAIRILNFEERASFYVPNSEGTDVKMHTQEGLMSIDQDTFYEILTSIFSVESLYSRGGGKVQNVHGDYRELFRRK